MQKTAACCRLFIFFHRVIRQQLGKAKAGAVAIVAPKCFIPLTSNNLVASGPRLDFRTRCIKLETKMKKIALAAALSVAASTAFAGGMATPVMEEAPIVAETVQTSSSNGGLLIPLLLLLVLAAAASNA
jgi:hypothetical protein